MEHIAAFLLVVSCSQDLSGCREIPAPAPLFEAYDACQAELPKVLGAFRSGGNRTFAKCLEVDPALEDDYDQLTWNVLPNGTIEAFLTVSSVVVASGTATGKPAYLH
ncbi:hypothetical protein QEZ47_20085 [Aminobacter anthyllidis]|uniref:hypothetical protein n=1 Tax=Aminobacter anthyllidis TaxID=1035067 RepID=UPI002458A1A4|nr:hypothetical protein [Aminobacter anthyllidis]MDH4987778.1 hypothetical protein [Aminobacter anthyllidis]